MDKKRAVYIVTANPAGGWTVTEEGRKPTLGTFSKRETALARAIKEAKSKPVAQVKVKGANGAFLTEFNIGDQSQ